MKYDIARFVHKEFIDKTIPLLKQEVEQTDFTAIPLYSAGQYAKLDIHNKWRMIAIKEMGHWVEGIESVYPTCSEFIKSFGDNCRSAGISILDPGGTVLPHTDTEVGHEDYVIAHVPLIIPQGDVGFIEGDETGHWVEGESFILDVETPHSIWNRSNEFRVVMLLELVKETAYV